MTYYQYIVVEGNIGSRKSEIAEKLALFLNATFFKENIEQNPFLPSFLREPDNYALALELQFLLDRNDLMAHIKREKEKNNSVIVSDCLIDKDTIFAPEILNQEELALYSRTKKNLRLNSALIPDLVILLQTSIETTYTALSQKGNQLIEASFPLVQKIATAYQGFFYIYPNIPFLIANSDELDLINNEEHFQLLIKTMSNLQGKINYLNLTNT